MLKKTAFINIDFLPPTAERFIRIPETSASRGYDSLCIRLIDNYPWSFDNRMKSDTAYDETIIDFVSRKCNELDLNLLFVFPGIDNFSRLLRLNGYKRLASGSSKVLQLDTEAVGFGILIESVAEDFTSLCTNLYSLAFEYSEADLDYQQKIQTSVENAGCSTVMLETGVSFLTAGVFIDGVDSPTDSAYMNLDYALTAFSDSVYKLKQYIIMSSIGSIQPAANEHNINKMYNKCLSERQQIDALLRIFTDSSAKLIETGWLAVFTKSVVLTADDELSCIESRMRQSGLLN